MMNTSKTSKATANDASGEDDMEVPSSILSDAPARRVWRKNIDGFLGKFSGETATASSREFQLQGKLHFSSSAMEDQEPDSRERTTISAVSPLSLNRGQRYSRPGAFRMGETPERTLRSETYTDQEGGEGILLVEASLVVEPSCGRTIS
jgi:hypothetical protein